MSGKPVGRLAPSPTGAQHVGNARTYLLAWLSIRARHGRLVLRIEDIDSPRVKAGADRQAIDDLRWLGLDWDEGPDIGGGRGPYKQTDRIASYQACLAELIRQEKVYPCTCTRSDVASAASAPHAGDKGPAYPGTCAYRLAADADALNDRALAWRFRSNNEPMEFDDQLRGSQRSTAGIDDFVIWKASQTPAYQLAVVVDDAHMGITEVLRGDDLVPSTYRQLLLYRCFGWPPPRFAHAPLVVGPDGRRLAKRHGDTRLATLREAGVQPHALVGLLAWSCGLLDRIVPITPRELLAKFNPQRISNEPFVLTGEHLCSIDFDVKGN